MAQEGMMGSINWGRVFLGGLLAGAVNNLLQFTANRLYLFRQWRAAMEALGLPTGFERPGYYTLFGQSDIPWPFVVLNLMAGVFVVWLYAMIRPRCGPGPRTAALAGLVFWLVSAMGPIVLWSASGMFPPIPPDLWATHLGTYLVIAVAMTVVGAWPYKE